MSDAKSRPSMACSRRQTGLALAGELGLLSQVSRACSRQTGLAFAADHPTYDSCLAIVINIGSGKGSTPNCRIILIA